MTEKLKDLAQEFKDKGYPEFGNLLLAQVPVARELGIPKTFSTVETKKSEIKRFSPEQKNALKKEGYVIYKLTGKSIKDLREAGNLFDSVWQPTYPSFEFETLRSRKSEVAINPNYLFFPNSSDKTYLEQESLVTKVNKDISAKIPGIEAIIGEVSDYVELAFLDPTDKRLYGNNYGYCTRTQTKIGSDMACVGGYYYAGGSGIQLRLYSDNGYRHIFITPLIVPKCNR